MTPSDLNERQRALDPHTSFIVQAPAGSGKTSLLTQRFLTLLSGVSVPEEILAITFTKKAAAEMRDRIVEALSNARGPAPTDSAYELQTWEIAQRALQQNDKMGWCVEENPARLRVVTIDSLCARLARGLPILSQFGAAPRAIEDASECYNKAAQRTLDSLYDKDSEFRVALAKLLLHLDNNTISIQEQVAKMLGRRDKWMRPLIALLGDLNSAGADALRGALEETLKRVVIQHLSHLKELFSRETLNELGQLARFAAEQLDSSDSEFEPWRHSTGLPTATFEDLPLWRGLSHLLLNLKGDWRKQVNKTQGFPANYKEEKTRFKTAIDGLRDNEVLRLALKEVNTLPPERYSDEQWEILQALLKISSLAVAELTLVFRELGLADFVEISHRAERALGTDDEPTDLAMALDAHLQHLLVDEFQDTSLGQLRLLERLTAEWVPGEGRTVFLVGDPMQSIYRFRDAEVGLFLQVRQQGLGQLRPESLTLRSNFRSQGCLVEWFNNSFSEIFPDFEDPGVGSVRYSNAEAARADTGTPVQCWAVSGDGDIEEKRRCEAESILKALEQAKSEDPDQTVAILVRNRNHLQELLPLLKREHHRFRGVDLEGLGKRSAVRDLLSLTTALCRPGERLPWLAILRAPWCGLTSHDLLAVATHAEDRPICSALAEHATLPELTDDGRSRLARVWPPLKDALDNRTRYSLRRLVEATWLRLGGPASLISQTALSDSQTFLDLLEEVDRSSRTTALDTIATKIERLFARPDLEADGRLEIMTIHKSKGLEFDTVILPGLSNGAKTDSEPLVSWLEWNDTNADISRLLLAPVSKKGSGKDNKDPVYQFVKSLEKKKAENEAKRVLYVAATRAKKKLHLVGWVKEDLKKDAGTIVKPSSGSFLSYLWPAVEDGFAHSFCSTLSNGESGSFALQVDDPSVQELPTLTVRRLSSTWSAPELPVADLVSTRMLTVGEGEPRDEPTFEWAGETARSIGTVVHRVLQQVGREGLEQWPPERLPSLSGYLSSRLSAAGVPSDRLEQATKDSLSALIETLSSDRGRWLFDSSHQNAQSEYAISGVWRNRLIRSVVDRTFIDEAGIRWVIDYKTTTHRGSDLNEFLDREVERYRPQLNRYARLLRRLDDRPVMMALYFPLLKAWREWPLDPARETHQMEFQFDS